MLPLAQASGRYERPSGRKLVLYTTKSSLIRGTGCVAAGAPPKIRAVGFCFLGRLLRDAGFSLLGCSLVPLPLAPPSTYLGPTAERRETP